MLEFFKRLFGANPSAPVPYKVEAPAKPAEFPFPSVKPATEKKPVAEKKPAVKNPAAKTKPVRKPKAPKA